MTAPMDTPENVERAPKIGYEEAKRLARHDHPGVRRALAERADVRPELLYFLAEDTDLTVRRAVAQNAAAPRQADLVLASDHDEGVRFELASKIGQMPPTRSGGSKQQLKQLTLEVLDVLARDQMVRVRQILAEALKDIAAAPPSVINRLARDKSLTVAGPILEFSPVLTDTDLLAIIRGRPEAGALTAIAGRRQVSADVADAVASTFDVPAVSRLLSNASAQIREETLDRIIDRAPAVSEWHAPLVQRPQLSAQAVKRLVHFVADSLLKDLQARKDLSQETLSAVADIVHQRLEGTDADAAAGTSAPRPSAGEGRGGGGSQPLPKATPGVDQLKEGALDRERRRARELHAADQLTEASIAEELTTGNRPFVVAALALAASLPEPQVRQILSGHNAKAVVALTWKAGFTMALAYDLQIQLAGILPRAAFAPDDSGGYGMSPEELTWQLELFES
ncbi:MAG: DUF2336 domain-containing protein [Proteobacteria bacterium]|nr:DUF2336 domain-containing protein [Pseudomonadota bacterium]MBI3499678.1 DUF2336 domain-containing protein [Pseudomonadota bacterium]